MTRSVERLASVTRPQSRARLGARGVEPRAVFAFRHDRAEQREQQQVVGGLARACDDEGPADVALRQQKPGERGVVAEARLRGTLVMLAAAARSSGVTTPITNACRAGTSICEKSERTRSRLTASQASGANAARISMRLAGRWVNTMVRIKP